MQEGEEEARPSGRGPRAAPAFLEEVRLDSGLDGQSRRDSAPQERTRPQNQGQPVPKLVYQFVYIQKKRSLLVTNPKKASLLIEKEN